MPIASAGPKGVSNQPQAISSPSPARANSPGLIASQRRKRSCSRPDPERPAGVGGVEHAVPLGQQALGVVERQVLLVALGADPDPLAEHPLEMRRAEADAGGDLVQRRLLGGARGDVVDGAADHRVVVGLGLRAWLGLVRSGCPEATSQRRARTTRNLRKPRLRARARRVPREAMPEQLDYRDDRTRSSDASTPPSPSRRASSRTPAPSPCSSRWRCRRRRPTAASTGRPRRCSQVADTPAEDAGARRGRADRAHQDHRPLPQQGAARHEAVGDPRRATSTARSRRRAPRCRACPASGARPPTSC